MRFDVVTSSRRFAWLLVGILFAGGCTPPNAASGTLGLPPMPVPQPPMPECSISDSVLEHTLTLLDDPRAAEGVEPCVDQLMALLVPPTPGRAPDEIGGPHPFWPGAAYTLTIDPQSPADGVLTVADYTGLGPINFDDPVQEIHLLIDNVAMDGESEETLTRVALRACVHVGQHLLRMGYLATQAGITSDCLGDANQLATGHARRSGFRAEPLAYAVQMLHAGEGRGGLLNDFFARSFAGAVSVEEVVAAETYGQWREAIGGYVESCAGGPPYLRRPYLCLSVMLAAESPMPSQWFGEACAARLFEAYTRTLDGWNPFEAYGSGVWDEWVADVDGLQCLQQAR